MIKEVHIFKAGKQTSAQGVTRDFTVGDLKEIANSYKPELHEALIVVGDLDIETTPEQGRIVFSRLSQAPSRQFTLIGGGTHSLLLENRRFQLFDVVRQYLRA